MDCGGGFAVFLGRVVLLFLAITVREIFHFSLLPHSFSRSFFPHFFFSLSFFYCSFSLLSLD
jgi:hypothetical protein